jgi:hypothetical protein
VLEHLVLVQDVSGAVDARMKEVMKKLKAVSQSQCDGLFDDPVLDELVDPELAKYKATIAEPMDLATLSQRIKHPMLEGGLFSWKDWQVCSISEAMMPRCHDAASADLAHPCVCDYHRLG